MNLPTSRWSPQCPICKLLKNSRKHSEGNNASMFNCQVTEFQQNSRRRRACVQMFSKQTISIFSHNIRCNTLWKTTLSLAAWNWKTIHTCTSMLLLPTSKLSQIKWPGQQRFAKISLFFSPCCSSFSPPIGLQKLPSPIYLTDEDRSSITRFNLSTN